MEGYTVAILLHGGKKDDEAIISCELMRRRCQPDILSEYGAAYRASWLPGVRLAIQKKELEIKAQ